MNVTCAAVSKWERGETYPDITLLQPLAYFFEVTLDELMGYDQKKVQADIDETIALYRKHWKDSKGREIIVKAYHDYPNDYRSMHYYMWNIGGDMADNNPTVLIEHKEEFLSICEKILGGCTEEALRLNAWNMRAKILHAEGKTDEALRIYQTKFADWYTTSGQKTEQLFAKDTDEYYFHVRKNMYELGDFCGRQTWTNRVLRSRAVDFGESGPRHSVWQPDAERLQRNQRSVLPDACGIFSRKNRERSLLPRRNRRANHRRYGQKSLRRETAGRSEGRKRAFEQGF